MHWLLWRYTLFYRAISMQKQSITCIELQSVGQMYGLAADDKIMKFLYKREIEGGREEDIKT